MMALLMTAVLGMTVFTGCGNGAGNGDETKSENQIQEEQFLGESLENLEEATLFPASEAGYVGDPMPFYDEGKFHVFYLLDKRDGHTGYHPWALYETENFYKYEDAGEVIPYGETTDDQDIALGTGSVIKDKEGVYHAFYTGHNDTRSPKEAIMHATSTDRKTWEKQPEDTFYAGKDYSQDDFRDPYVLYNEEEGCYWMLVTTRSNNTGVIVRYSSKDLKTWKDKGIFFENDMGTDSNMECPSLLSFQGKWYLAFSDQWPYRQVHYRMADSPKGPFTKPEPDVLDGNGFYAGRLETDGDDLYLFGWNATKVGHNDANDYDWAGNLVVHQLKQTEDGRLLAAIGDKVSKGLDHEVALSPVRVTETVGQEKGYKFIGESYEAVVFNNLNGNYLLKGKISNFKNSEKFGLSFNTDDDGVGKLNLVFDVKEGKFSFYNTNELYAMEPQSQVDIDFDTDELEFVVMIGGGVVSAYVNDKCALTARMYASQGNKWGIFGIRSEACFEDLKVYK